MLPLLSRFGVFSRINTRKCGVSLVLPLVFVSGTSCLHAAAAQTWGGAGGDYPWSSDLWSKQQGQDDITIPWDDNWGEDDLSIPWLGEEHDYGDGFDGQQWPWSQLEPYGEDGSGRDSDGYDDNDRYGDGYGDGDGDDDGSADSGHERADGYGQHHDGGHDAEEWVQYKRTMPRSGSF